MAPIFKRTSVTPDSSLSDVCEQVHHAGGAVDFFIDNEHIKELFPKGMTRSKFTYQLSDHLPLWIQINTDIDEMQLDQIIRG